MAKLSGSLHFKKHLSHWIQQSLLITWSSVSISFLLESALLRILMVVKKQAQDHNLKMIKQLMTKGNFLISNQSVNL